jgi:hypothetical protein
MRNCASEVWSGACHRAARAPTRWDHPGMTETSVVRIAKGIQRHREWGVFFAEMLGSNACTVTPFGRTVDVKFRPFFEKRELL